MALTPDQKRARLAELLREKNRQPQRVTASFAQERMWVQERLAPGSATLNVPVSVRLSGQLDEDALRRAGIEMPYPQTDLHLRSLFGIEGEEARKALHLTPARQAKKRDRGPGPASSSNDAVDDLMSGGGVDMESPPVETAPDVRSPSRN